jgi:periplasmic protein TonB
MFEDSTFESTGRIRTRSRGWMIATFLFNGSILLALILIPLIYPEALPRQFLTFLLTVPPPPVAPPPAPKEPQHVFHGRTEMPNGVVLAPQIIPRDPLVNAGPERAPGEAIGSLDDNAGAPNGIGVFANRHTVVVHPDVAGPVRLSSVLVAGLALYKPAPPYPAIARAAGVQGTVVLQAMISKDGSIENLRVVSGPVMLQQAALDTVKTWRYRPYLLNNLPVEVETTVNVVFTMGR